jgi:hypothetical protein
MWFVVDYALKQSLTVCNLKMCVVCGGLYLDEAITTFGI